MKLEDIMNFLEKKYNPEFAEKWDNSGLIIGRKGTINNPIFVSENFWNVDTAFGMKPQKMVDDTYFYYFCLSFNFSKLDKSTAVPSLTKTTIGNLALPIPPLPEQHRIVAKIEELFAVLDNIQNSLEA